MIRQSRFAWVRRRMACLCACAAVSGTLLSGSCARAQASADRAVEVVECRGSGTNLESAKDDACREAVRQVVGAYMASKTTIENDRLIEDKVISLSSGFVEKMETLESSRDDGWVRVTIRATVRSSKVLESLNTNGISVKVDGASMGARLLTTTDQKKAEAELVEAAFDGFPAKWFKATVQGDPRLGERAGGSRVSVVVAVEIEQDREHFLAAATKLDEAFKATERPHGTFDVSGALLGPGMTASGAQESANGFLRGIMADGGASQQLTAGTFVHGRSVFPQTIQAYPGTTISGERLMEPGLIPVMFPVKIVGNGRQSTWHWYGLKVPEAVQYIAPHARKALRCRIALKNESGEDIAFDTCGFRCTGIGGMRHWEDFMVNSFSHQAAVAVAPAAIVGQVNSIDWLIPKFRFERTIVLEEDEVRTIADADVELETE